MAARQRHGIAWWGRAGVRGVLACAVLVGLHGCAYVSRLSDVTGRPGVDLGAYGAPALSADGRYAAYAAYTDSGSGTAHFVVLRRDNLTLHTDRVDVASDESPADGPSRESAISADGRFVAFTSDADNLSVEVDDNDAPDVFVRDMLLGTTERVSLSSTGEQGDLDSYAPSISADGRYVVFTSDSDLFDPADENGSPDVYLHDRQTHTTTLVSVSTDGMPTDFGAWDGVISADGLHVAFTTDTDWVASDENFSYDVYVRDLAIPRTRRISVTAAGIDGGELPAISANGSIVAYIADTGDVYHRQGTTTRKVNAGVLAGAAGVPAMSADGRWVAFTSFGDASGTDTNGFKADVFVRDMLNNVTTIGSTTSGFMQLAADSINPTISSDGKYVAWVSAGAFDATDKNGLNDLYLRGLAVPKITSVTPNVVSRGTTVNVTVSGRAFVSPLSAMVGQNAGGVTVNSATWVSDSTVTLNVTVAPTATLGFQAVGIFNHGSGIGPASGAGGDCANCLRVE
jgi:Tol biopolymer transport system component